jgi:hypothetical protein
MEAAAPEVSGAEEEDESSEPQALRARATRTTATAAEHLMRVLMPFLSAGQIAGGVPAPSSFSYC